MIIKRYSCIYQNNRNEKNVLKWRRLECINQFNNLMSTELEIIKYYNIINLFNHLEKDLFSLIFSGRNEMRDYEQWWEVMVDKQNS